MFYGYAAEGIRMDLPADILVDGDAPLILIIRVIWQGGDEAGKIGRAAGTAKPPWPLRQGMGIARLLSGKPRYCFKRIDIEEAVCSNDMPLSMPL